MSIAIALLLGLVQGLTEFLPISSSAHVQLTESLLHLNYDKASLTAFIATIQLGTELAVLIYFAKDIWRILSAWFKSLLKPATANSDSKLGWLIIIGSLPVIVIGLLFKDAIESTLKAAPTRRLIRLPHHINDPEFAGILRRALMARAAWRGSMRHAAPSSAIRRRPATWRRTATAPTRSVPDG